MEGLEIYQQHKDEIALVITDLVMPRLSGAQLFNELIKLKPDVKVMVISGYSDNEQIERLQRMGVRTVVHKPLRRAELAMQVRNMLDSEV